jgi:DNA repair protein RadA/Sms
MAFRCTECGFATGKWMGFCPQCRTHGSVIAAATAPAAEGAIPIAVGDALTGSVTQRRPVGVGEFDRVLGGGLVEGSVVLVGGEPGVGKSTLLLQLAARVAGDKPVLYVSGEESARQIALRAERIAAVHADLAVLAATDIDVIERTVEGGGGHLVIVDSVQTCRSPDTDGAPGGITQVRECGARLAALARRTGVPVVLVGHVTKDGGIAGPKVLEHLVDVVLYLEGDPDRGLRYVRGIKNRYGSVDQVGVFEMTDRGMREVPDPSGVFVDGWSGGVAGTVIYPAVYGRRSLLVEIQALVTPTGSPQPRRSVKGIEAARVHQLLAVLDRHAGLSCAQSDVYVNVVGGLTLRDPAADLPAALAIASALVDRPLGGVAAFGEVGLTGEVRAVAHRERRRGEAERFGLTDVITAADVDRLDIAVATAGLGSTERGVRVAAG